MVALLYKILAKNQQIFKKYQDFFVIIKPILLKKRIKKNDKMAMALDNLANIIIGIEFLFVNGGTVMGVEKQSCGQFYVYAGTSYQWWYSYPNLGGL